jgi:hypothetical protein
LFTAIPPAVPLHPPTASKGDNSLPRDITLAVTLSLLTRRHDNGCPPRPRWGPSLWESPVTPHECLPLSSSLFCRVSHVRSPSTNHGGQEGQIVLQKMMMPLFLGPTYSESSQVSSHQKQLFLRDSLCSFPRALNVVLFRNHFFSHSLAPCDLFLRIK